MPSTFLLSKAIPIFAITSMMIFLGSELRAGEPAKAETLPAAKAFRAILSARTDAGLFVFSPEDPQHFDLQIRDVSGKGQTLRFVFRVFDGSGQIWHRREQEVVLKAGAEANVPLNLQTGNWPLGPYDGEVAIFLSRSDSSPVWRRAFRMGIISSNELSKARPDEFLYGLDASNRWIYHPKTPEGFAWYRIMGVDILRDLGGKGMRETPDEVGLALEELRRENLMGMLSIDPPKDRVPQERKRNLQTKVAFIEETMKRYAGQGPGRISYVEVGNEPDLPVFYPGSMDEYIADYSAIYEAGKRGAAAAGLQAADTVIMNGGLSFAGETGKKRAKEFLEQVNPETLDAVAYHGHGPGIEAERSAYLRAKEILDQRGLDHLRLIETESGFSGGDQRGLMAQARTVVEKMTFAQSVHMPVFFYFRLFMEGIGSEGGYGMSDGFVEPRPSILAYRNMVEQLRHHRFVASLDAEGGTGTLGAHAFLFQELDLLGQPTGRKVVVAFSEYPKTVNLLLQLDVAQVNVDGLQVADLFGNAAPTDLLEGNLANIPVGIDPVYVMWKSAGAAESVAVSNPLLQVLGERDVVEGETTKLLLKMRNPGEREATFELRAQLASRTGGVVTPTSSQLRLGAHQSADVPIEVRLEAADVPLSMPRLWRVFIDPDREKLTKDLLEKIPESLPTAMGSKEGEMVWAPDMRIHFGKLASGIREKRAGVAYATIISPTETQLSVAASADWYMAWYVNGREVYNTLETGNAHGGLGDHTFELPLRKGANTVAVLVLSGSHGWDVQFGGPKERAIAVTNGLDPDHLEIEVICDGKRLLHQIEPLGMIPAVPVLPEEFVTGDSLAWNRIDPVVVAGEETITNLWVKEPQQDRWYGGKGDLSATVWMASDATHFYLAVEATDDHFVTPSGDEEIPDHDSLRVVLADEAGNPLLDTSAALGSQGILQQFSNKTQAPVWHILRIAKKTFYLLAVPSEVVGDTTFRVNLLLRDNDSGFLKQTLGLGNVEAPAEGMLSALRDSP